MTKKPATVASALFANPGLPTCLVWPPLGAWGLPFTKRRRATDLFLITIAVIFFATNAAYAVDGSTGYNGYTAQIGKLAAEAKYKEALAIAGQFAEISRKQEGPVSLPYARATSWKAFLHLILGDHGEAAPLFEEALAIYEKRLKPDDPELATAISNLGISRETDGHQEDAERLFRRALEIRERALPSDHREIADSLNNLANVYKTQDRLEEAEMLLRRALAIREKTLPANSPAIAESLQNLASALELEGRDAEAEPLLRKAIVVRKASQPPLHPEIAGALHHLAHNLQRQRRFRDAEAQYNAALQIRERSQPPGHPDIARNLEDLALLYVDEKEFAVAAPLLKRVIAMFEKAYSGHHPSMIQPLEMMAIIAQNDGQALEALNYARRGTQIAVEREKLTQNTRVALENHVRLAWKVYEANHYQDQALFEEAFVVAQRAGLTATGASISKLAVRLATTDPTLRDVFRERQDLEGAREATDREFDALFLVPRDDRGDAEQKVRNELQKIQSRLKEIDAKIKTEFPRYSELVRPSPLSLKEIREFLQADEALVYFSTSETETFAWAITKNDAAWRRLDMTRSDIEAYDRKLRNALKPDRLGELASDGELFDLGVAHDVYRRLFGPMESVIKGKQQLIVVSSGPLTSMPFQSLIVTPPPIKRPTIKSFDAYQKADWVIRHYALSVLPAVSNLKALRSEGKAREDRRSLIGFANPKYGDQTVSEAETKVLTRSFSAFWKGATVNLDMLRAELTPLLESEQELRSVARSLGAADEDLKFGAEASEAVVKQAKLENFRIIYFAVHGLVAGDFGGLGEPALALALPAVASELDDGLLTMSEISKLRLDADWVVLSACSTAAGDRQSAEIPVRLSPRVFPRRSPRASSFALAGGNGFRCAVDNGNIRYTSSKSWHGTVGSFEAIDAGSYRGYFRSRQRVPGPVGSLLCCRGRRKRLSNPCAGSGRATTDIERLSCLRQQKHPLRRAVRRAPNSSSPNHRLLFRTVVLEREACLGRRSPGLSKKLYPV